MGTVQSLLFVPIYPYRMVQYGIPQEALSWILVKGMFLRYYFDVIEVTDRQQYNYILSASFGSAIAIAGIVIFFSLQWKEININWWGNDIVNAGCEGTPCTRLTLAKGEYFGPRIGEFH